MCFASPPDPPKPPQPAERPPKRADEVKLNPDIENKRERSSKGTRALRIALNTVGQRAVSGGGDAPRSGVQL